MKAFSVGAALIVAYGLSMPTVALAKGSGAGHSGGGHSGSHSGHASGGHSGQARGNGSSPGAGVHRGSGSGSTARSSSGRPPGTAVPRVGPPLSPTAPSTAYVPHVAWPYRGHLLGFGWLGIYDDPYFYDYPYNYPFLYGYGGYGYLSGTSPQSPDSPSGYAPYPIDRVGPTGGLRLKVEPKEAQVYVDGYYAGIVDDFNGRFQRLTLGAGAHHIEIRAPGRQSLTLDVDIQSQHTIEYRGTLLPAIP